MLPELRVWLSDPSNLALVQSAGILFGLTLNALGFLIAALAFWRNRKLHALRFISDLTKSHRDIWQLTIGAPSLTRVTDPNPDLVAVPISEEEKRLVNLIFLNMFLAFEADRLGIYKVRPGSEQDVKKFVRLPIPRRVWKTTRDYQDARFARFIDGLYERAQAPPQDS